MADPNYLRSPLDLLADEQNKEAEALLAGQQRARATAPMPDVSTAKPVAKAAPAPANDEPVAPRRMRSASLLPPDEYRPLFDAAADKHGVPVNVVMALAQQESGYNPKAIGAPTEWGTAKGMLQYLDSTAKGHGINAFDPAQAIDAAAKEIRSRMDKGMSFDEIVMEHFAGPDRKLWGPKTAAYGKEVIAKAYKIGDLLMNSAQASEAPAAKDIPKDWTPLTNEQAAEYEAKQGNHFSAAMPREEYENTFRINNPQATPEAVAFAMNQFDQQKAARGKQQVDSVGARFETLKSPEATFDAKLNAKLAGDAQGIVPALPGKAKPTPPEKAANPIAPSSGALGDIARNLKVGADIAAQDLRELVKYLPGGKAIVAGGDAVDRYFHPEAKDSADLLERDAQQMQESMTPEMQEALKRKWYDSDKGKLGDAWTDWRSYAGGIIQSLPEQALTMGPTMGLAKAAYTAKVAAGATIAAASQTAAKTAMVAGALSEGALGGASSSREVRHDVLNLKDDVLAQSDAFKALLAQGMSHEQAKKTLAEDLAARAFVTSGVVTGMFGGMGDRAIAKLFTEQVGKSVVKRAISGFGKGAVAEGVFEELPQSAGQRLAQNEAVKQADPNKPLMDDVANQALGGAVQGGLQGGGMGGMAAAANQNAEQQPVAEPAPAPSPVAPTQVAPIPAAAVPTTSGPLSSAVEQVADSGQQRVVVSTADGQSATGTMAEYHEADDGFVAQIVGDDGQVYTITDQDGLQITPVEPAPAGPLTSAVETVAEEHAVAPAAPNEQALAEIEATKPPPPPPPPATPEEMYGEMDLPALRERLKYIAEQAKNSGGMNKMFMDHRKAVEKAIKVKTDEAQKASKLAEEPLSSGPFDDMAAANKMALRVAEKSGVPQEVVEANGKFKIKPIEEQNDGGLLDEHDRGVGNVSGRSDRPAGGNGATVANGPVPNGGDEARAGDVRGDGGATGQQHPVGGARAVAPAEPKPALIDEHVGKTFKTDVDAKVYIAKHKIGKTHRIVVNSAEKYEVRPVVRKAAKAAVAEKPVVAAPSKADKAATRQAKIDAQVATANDNAAARAAEKAAPVVEPEKIASDETKVPDLAPTEQQAASGVPEATAGDSRPAPAAKPKKLTGKAAVAERARQLADYFTPGNVVKAYGGHDRIVAYEPNEDGGFSVTVQSVVKQYGEWVAAEGAAGRERTHATKPDERTLRAGPIERAPAKEEEVAAAPEPVEQAKPEPEQEAAAEPTEERDDGADIPKAFYKKVKVPVEVWIQDEGKYETVDLPASEALASVREDIVNLRSLLDCMRG